MRPRGESGSWPSSAYVGQVGRQNPQWTHWSSCPYSSSASTGAPLAATGRVSGVAIAAATSDPAHEAARIETPVRIEPGLEPPHERDGRAGRVPYGAPLAHAQRRPLDGEVSTARPRGVAAPGERRGRRSRRRGGAAGREKQRDEP